MTVRLRWVENVGMFVPVGLPYREVSFALGAVVLRRLGKSSAAVRLVTDEHKAVIEEIHSEALAAFERGSDEHAERLAHMWGALVDGNNGKLYDAITKYVHVVGYPVVRDTLAGIASELAT